MPKDRFFHSEPFEKGQTITLQDAELHHLRVMRPQEKEIIELVNGKNELAHAELLSIDRRKATLHVLDCSQSPPPKRALILAQAFLKPKNLELIVEKGTELGATAFWLFPGENSDKETLSENQLIRLRQLTISALKQCGRLDLPPIEVLPSLEKWHTPIIGKSYFGSLQTQTQFAPSQEDMTLFIGPEKGFTNDEEQALSNLGSTSISLNPNILRAETATLCALAIANSQI